MRYAIQVLCMLGDLMFCLAMIVFIAWSSQQEIIFSLVAILSAAIVLKSWWNDGGLMAWHPKNIKAFLENAKKIGL